LPFPLAHPVLVLPFRKWCPKRLSLLGLVIGSITPDVGYTLRHFDLNGFSHSVLGSVAFCLPVGWLVTRLVFAIRGPLARTLPAPHRQALLPLCESAFPSWTRLTLSLLIGVWTHIAFDALTHESALVAQGRESLRGAVLAVEQTGLKVYHVLWISISLGCLGLLGFFYGRFLKRSTGAFRLFDPGERGRALWWVALLVGPYLLVVPFTYHVFEPHGFRIDKFALYGSLQPYLLLLAAELTAVGFVVRSRETRSR
jgi:hypothetical protein